MDNFRLNGVVANNGLEAHYGFLDNLDFSSNNRDLTFIGSTTP